MNLLALRTEVLNHGFDGGVYGARINQYLNDALQKIGRTVMYYTDEATLDFNTVVGQTSYSQPTDFARDRSLRETDTQTELGQVTLRDIDRSAAVSGAPRWYAIDGALLHLYPTPDQAYPMELRYWKLPAPLVADTDVPGLPDAYHSMLWYWGCKECFAADDDMATSQYWEQQFARSLADFEADVKFPTSDAPQQVRGMWSNEGGLSPGGWRIYGSGWD